MDDWHAELTPDLQGGAAQRFAAQALLQALHLLQPACTMRAAHEQRDRQHIRSSSMPGVPKCQQQAVAGTGSVYDGGRKHVGTMQTMGAAQLWPKGDRP